MARLHAVVVLCLVGSASIVSCGGAAFDDDGGAGSGASSGAGRGGSSSGSGGVASGGTVSAGAPGAGTTGKAGTGGGGSLSELCSQPAQSGECNAYFPSFFHNPETGVCEPFAYGGCGGNDNRFASVEECQAACSGGSPDLDSCESPLDCVLAHTGCCAPCDGGIENYAAINAAHEQQFYEGRTCDLACAPCPAPDPTLANQSYQTATCRNGQCVPIDVREEGAADCQSQNDCRLRDGIGCCEGCGGGEWSLVALNTGDALAELVCGDMAVGCPACAPMYPAEYVAMCEANRCELRRSAQP